MLILLAIVAGNVIGFAFLVLLTPLYIDRLVNKPGTGNIHFFTYLEEGMAKVIVRGETFIRCIMSFSDHGFARVGRYDSQQYWQIIEKSTGEDPIADVNWFLRPFARYIFWATGAVFTGIYPFQTVREYTLERTKMMRHEAETHDGAGDLIVNAEDKHDDENIVLYVKEDKSDHYRVREFNTILRAPKVDTLDSISVNVLLVIRARVTNPNGAAFGNDRWDQKLVNLAISALSDFTRTNTLDNVLSAKETSKLLEFKQAILDIKDDELSGFDIIGVDVIDISANLDEEDRKKLYAEALAKPLAAATLLDGKTRANVIREINAANEAGGAFALATLQTEAQVRMAKEAKGGATIFLGQSGSDQQLTAILAELQKLNKGNVAT